MVKTKTGGKITQSRRPKLFSFVLRLLSNPCNQNTPYFLLAEKQLKYGSHQRLYEKHLGEICKLEVKTYQLQPVCKQRPDTESIIIRIIKSCSKQTHGWAHQAYSGADDCSLKYHRMTFPRIEDAACPLKGTGTSHDAFQSIRKAELNQNHRPYGKHSPKHIDTSLSPDRANHRIRPCDIHEQIAIYHIQTIKHIGMYSY